MVRRTLATLACGLALVASAAAGRVYPRYPLDVLMDDPRLSYQKELFLLGMHEITTTSDISSIWSHYQLGGIHGLPFTTYNNAETGVRWESFNGTWYGGLCWHFTNPWMHWHRFYMLQYEQAMRRGAASALKQILHNGQGMSAAQKREWRQAYKALRLPRWDWTDPRIATLGLPTILLEERMLVTNPQRPLGPKLDLHNPLHSYLMQADAWKTAPPATTVYGNKLRNSQPFNISTGQYTYRYPKVGANGQLESDSPVFNAVFKKVVRALDIEIRLAMQPNTWDCWALGPANRNPNVNCDLWIPCVNDVHSNIHALTGGFGSSGVTGVMLQAETTGLDPIFHVHHSQIDWLFAIYRAFKPQVALTNGNFMDGTYLFRPAPDDYNAVGTFSEMSPFTPKSRQNNKFWLAKDADKYTKHFYTYSEIFDAARAAGISTQKMPTDNPPAKVALFQQKLDEILFAKYNLKSYYSGYWQAAAFVVNTTALPQPADQFNIKVVYTAGGANIECGTWGSFAEQGMLGNNAMGEAFVERYPTIQLTNCLLQAGVVNNTTPAAANAANPGAGPACRPIPAQLNPLDTTVFTVTMTTTYSGGAPVSLTPTQTAAAITAAPTYWAFEESYIKLPNGLNAGLPLCV